MYQVIQIETMIYGSSPEDIGGAHYDINLMGLYGTEPEAQARIKALKAASPSNSYHSHDYKIALLKPGNNVLNVFSL